MAPHPRVLKAFQAMRALGIPDERTKPVLKRLLRVYDKNWELIELEDYRVLIDAIFESEELEAAKAKGKEAEQADSMKTIEEKTQIPECESDPEPNMQFTGPKMD